MPSPPEKSSPLLYVCFSSIQTHVIDSQVLVHCALLREAGIPSEIWFFCATEMQYRFSINRMQHASSLSKCIIKVFRAAKPSMPFSVILNALWLRTLLKGLPFGLIHARGDYASAVVGKAKLEIPFIWDCRGSMVGEFKRRTTKSKLPKFITNLHTRRIQQWMKTCRESSSFSFFVTNYLQDKYGKVKTSAVFPCTADSSRFFYDPVMRTKMRNKLGLHEEKVLLFSGSLNYYQGFDQSLEFFCALQAHGNWKYLVLTVDPNKVPDIAKSNPNIIVLSVPFEDVNNYLCATDFGILIRTNEELNWAASPLKYAEYCMCGLTVFYTPNIGDLDSYSAKIGNGLPISLEYLPQCAKRLADSVSTEEQRQTFSSRARKQLSRQAIFNRYLSIYSSLLDTPEAVGSHTRNGEIKDEYYE